MCNIPTSDTRFVSQLEQLCQLVLRVLWSNPGRVTAPGDPGWGGEVPHQELIQDIPHVPGVVTPQC